MQNRKRDTDVQKRLLDSVGEGKGGMFWENNIETSILSRVKQITSPGWMHELKMTSYIFKWLKTTKKKEKKKTRLLLCDMWKLYEIQVSLSINRILLKCFPWASLVAQPAKNPPAVRETWFQSVGGEDPLEKGKATHPSILAWRIPGTMQSMGSRRVRRDWVTFTFTYFTEMQPELFAHYLWLFHVTIA